MTTSALLLILNSTRAADIPGVLKGLDDDQKDHLMTYLYKVRHAWGTDWVLGRRECELMAQGMAALGNGADVSGSVLLTWHEKVSVA